MSDNQDHDQRFKQMLEAFWPELLSILAPQLPAPMRDAEPEFLRQEHYTDLLRGERRILDLVAKLSPPRLPPLLVHVEVEAQYRSEFPERMWNYYAQPRLRLPFPVLPLAIFLKGGPPGLQTTPFSAEVFGKPVLSFAFESLGLSGASAEDFLARPEKLAIGLAALMRFSSGNEAQHKLACIRRLALEDMSALQRTLLLDCIRAYLPLRDPALSAYYDSLLAQEPQERVRAMELSWSQQIRQEGHQEGRQEGRQEGHTEAFAKLFSKRLKRELNKDEKSALSTKLESLGADRLSDVLFDLTPAELLAWLLDAKAR